MAISQKHTPVIFLAVATMIMMMLICIEAAPRPGEEWERNPDPCAHDTYITEVCQRCAKKTKSPLVYPMCCNGEDLVHEWCKQYLYFGRQS